MLNQACTYMDVILLLFGWESSRNFLIIWASPRDDMQLHFSKYIIVVHITRGRAIRFTSQSRIAMRLYSCPLLSLRRNSRKKKLQAQASRKQPISTFLLLSIWLLAFSFWQTAHSQPLLPVAFS